MHASISGTIDFKEKDDDACIQRLWSRMVKYRMPSATGNLTDSMVESMAQELLDEAKMRWIETATETPDGGLDVSEEFVRLATERPPARPREDVYSVFSDTPGAQYDIRDV